MKLEFSRRIFEKRLDIKFNQNPFSGSRVFPCEETDGRTDVTKLIVVFRNFSKAPKTYKNSESVSCHIIYTNMLSRSTKSISARNLHAWLQSEEWRCAVFVYASITNCLRAADCIFWVFTRQILRILWKFKFYFLFKLKHTYYKLRVSYRKGRYTSTAHKTIINP